MTSRAFSCNATLIRKNLSRFWLLSLGIAVLLLIDSAGLFIGLTAKTSHAKLMEGWGDRLVSFATGPRDFLMAVVLAPCMFSYLYKKRNSSFFHSLPLSRDGLFLSSFLSGLLLFALPLLLHVVLSVPQILIYHSHCTYFLTTYFQAVAYRLLQFFLCYTMAVFAMVLSGRVFFGVAAALLLHIIFPVVEFLLYAVLDSWLFGLNSFIDAEPITRFLAPYAYLQSEIPYFSFDLPWRAMGIYSAVALLLAGLSLWLHRKRKEENVGQSFVFSPVLSVLQYLLTFLFSFLLWILFSVFVGGHIASGYLLLPWIIPAFFLVRMLLLRTRKVFQRKAFLSCGIFVLAFGLFLFTFQADLLGIVRRVPGSNEVEQVSVKLYHMEYVTADADTIRDILDIHRGIVENKDALQEERNATGYDLELTYTMKSGRTMYRTYTIHPSYSNGESMNVQNALRDLLLEGDRSVDQLHRLKEHTEDVSFRIGDSKLISLSTREKEQLFLALEQDLAQGMDPLMILNIKGNSSQYELHLEPNHKNSYYSHYIDLPYSATVTRAFLDELMAKTESPS